MVVILTQDHNHEFLPAFSCHAKEVILLGKLLRENILLPILHRQYVFNVPIILDKFSHCQAGMKIISFIVERKVVRKILTHLKLWPGNNIHGSPSRPGKLGVSSTHPGQQKHYEPVDDGWPGYDEPIYGSD
jgi:hypothetical protein